MLKMTLLPRAQHRFKKSQKFLEHLNHSLRNGSQSPERRVDSTPPALIRVKEHSEVMKSFDIKSRWGNTITQTIWY